MGGLQDATDGTKRSAARFCRHYSLSATVSSLAGLVLLLLWKYGGSGSQHPLLTERHKSYPGTVDGYTSINPDDVPWSLIEPSKDLEYHQCYGVWQCARLLVPLDWQKSDDHTLQIALAILKIPAKVHVTDPRYGGAILINPGGPGGSGASKIFRQGLRMQRTVDSLSDPGSPAAGNTVDDGKFFDIIGWDPRSINHTQPQLNCFSDSFQRLIWTLQADAEGLVDSSDAAFDRVWARFQSRSETCMERVAEAGEDSIAYHMGTTTAVRDMVEIAERHGKWREAQAEKWLNNARVRNEASRPPFYSPDAIRERTKWLQGNERVLYWGISYGTFIGATLAAMYPDRIQRAVLDSVMIPESYVSGNWTENLQDADKVMDEFAKYCYRYGPKNCPFYREAGPNTIVQDYIQLQEALKQTPLAVPGSAARGPDVITHSDVEDLVRTTVYHPIDSFPTMANLLQDVSQANGSSFADYKAGLRLTTFSNITAGIYSLTKACEASGPYSPACQMPNEWHDENQAGVFCSDGQDTHNISKEDFKKFWRQLQDQSRIMGNLWAEYRMMCIGWTAQAKWKFSGPFSGKTAHPMLLAGNVIDPVCPIRNAYKLSKQYEGSVVLEQNTVGHETLTAPSNCTEAVIRKYFQSGHLPKHGASCDVDQNPLDGSGRRMGW